MRADEIKAAVEVADRRIRPAVLETPLRHSPHFSRETGAEVYFKLENVQVTGSFKARGAVNKVAALSAEDRARGIVTASSGNHGAATAFALASIGATGIVFVPTTTPDIKVAAIRSYGAEVRFQSDDGGEAEVFARQFAAENGRTYISPYNDPDIIAGQGTVGLEISRRLPAPDHLVVAVGGGGLIAGTAGYLKSVRPGLRVVGVSPRNDHAMALSVGAGRVVVHENAKATLSDGTAGGVEPGSITLPLCRELIDHWVLPEEAAIADAMRTYVTHENQLLEGAAGAAIAGFLADVRANPSIYRDKAVVIVVCGARIDPKKLAAILG